MKTIKFLAAMVAAFAISINVYASNKVNTVSVKPDQSMSVHYKYNNVGEKKFKTVYSTDEQGRVISKIILVKGYDAWEPVGAYTVYYGEEENIVTYAAWNRSSKAFNKNAVQQHFNAKDYPVVIALPKILK